MLAVFPRSARSTMATVAASAVSPPPCTHLRLGRGRRLQLFHLTAHLRLKDTANLIGHHLVKGIAIK